MCALSPYFWSAQQAPIVIYIIPLKPVMIGRRRHADTTPKKKNISIHKKKRAMQR